MPILTCLPLTLKTVIVTSSPMMIDSLVRLLKINKRKTSVSIREGCAEPLPLVL